VRRPLARCRGTATRNYTMGGDCAALARQDGTHRQQSRALWKFPKKISKKNMGRMREAGDQKERGPTVFAAPHRPDGSPPGRDQHGHGRGAMTMVTSVMMTMVATRGFRPGVGGRG
jgi:hypothetical protein